MKKNILLLLTILSGLWLKAETIVVNNAAELRNADRRAKPGDSILLRNGAWRNATIAFTAHGTDRQPIVFRAMTPGNVIFSGLSSLRIGGDYLVITGFDFRDGSSPSGGVWEFRAEGRPANHCRITDCVIESFNNPKRTSQNDWVSFYGKNNRVDHCSFINKTNFGVLMAVLLDDDRSRENSHSIDHNYFGRRVPLGSNGGEIIRVGLAQHCTFYSNTDIRENLFEHCDGEAEIISIKSCGNIIRGNVFKECEGGLSLRHGNNNTVEGNLFLGNGKNATGGVRVINEGNWVVNNLFYACRGQRFRSPLAIMNGVPNSPPTRYLPVRDAVIAHNSFVNCAPFSLCEGSDSERSVTPRNVYFADNLFLNRNDSLLYFVFDNTDSIFFRNNKVSSSIRQSLLPGFEKITLRTETKQGLLLPLAFGKNFAEALPDSILHLAGKRLLYGFPKNEGCDAIALSSPAYTGQGTIGSPRNNVSTQKKISTVVYATADCANVDAIRRELEKKRPVLLVLTGKTYRITAPLIIESAVIISGGKNDIRFETSGNSLPFTFELKGGASLELRGITLDLAGLHSQHFISTDTSGSSNLSRLAVTNCRISNFNSPAGGLLNIERSSTADRIDILNSSFRNNNSTLLAGDGERGKNGYYPVEFIEIRQNSFIHHQGILITLVRSGGDESTLGPRFNFMGNTVRDCTVAAQPLLDLTGVQYSAIEDNLFEDSNADGSLLRYVDGSRAVHYMQRNTMTRSGAVVGDRYVMHE